MGEQPQLTFRIAPWRPWLIALAPLATLAAVGVIMAIVAGAPAAAAAVLIGFVVVAVLLLLLITLTVRSSRWHVDPNGIAGRNNMLAYHRLEWSEIGSVEPWPIPGYRYVQVKNVRGRRMFWLPLFLTDMPRLRSAVAQYAPAGNPLRQYLEHHVT